MNKIGHKNDLQTNLQPSTDPAGIPATDFDISVPFEPYLKTPSAAASWATAKSGFWATAANWSPSGVPTSSTAVTISVAGKYTVTINAAASAQSLTINNATASVSDSAALSLGGSLALTAGTFTLASGANITGATLSAGTGGTYIWTNGTLTADTYQGTLTLGTASAYLDLVGATTITGAGGTGAGAINITGTSAELDIHGSLTGAAAINLTGSAATIYAYDSVTLNNTTLTLGNNTNVYNYESTGQPSTLTLGSAMLVTETATSAIANITIDDQDAGNTLINQGTISNSAAGGNLNVYGGYVIDTFLNQGTLAVSNGATLSLSGAGAFINSGTISIAGTASSFILGLNETTAALGTIVHSAGTLALAGTLTNTGATLALGTGTAIGQLTLQSGGVIIGGTIADAGQGISATGGTLSSVTYEGTINLSAPDAYLILTGANTITGAGGSGAGTINLTGTSSELDIYGTVAGASTFNDTGTSSVLFLYNSIALNNGVLNIGNATGVSYLYNYASTGVASTLTLGSSFTLNETTAAAQAYIDIDNQNLGCALVNQGTITASASSGSLSINASYASTKFINQGLLAVSNGDTVSLNGAGTFTNTGLVSLSGSNSVLSLGMNETTAGLGNIQNLGGTLELAGTLTNTGAILAVGIGTALGAIEVSGDIIGGTIADAGGGIDTMGGTFTGVTYEGVLNLSTTSAYLILSGGNTLTGAGGTGATTINVTGQSSELDVHGALTGAATINDTGISSSVFLYDSVTLASTTINIGNAGGADYLYNYNTVSHSTLTLGAGSSVNEITTGAAVYLYIDAQNEGNALINQGTITAGASGGALTIYGQYTGDSFTNTGSLLATGGGTLTFEGLTKFTNVTTGTLTAGNFEVDASSTLIVENNASITTDSSNITLSGAGSVFEWYNTGGSKFVALDSTLNTVSATGSLHLLNSRSFTTTAFTDNGVLQLAGGNFDAKTSLTLNSGASFSGFGSVTGPITNSGIIQAAGGNLLLSGSIAGTGALQIATGATLEAGSTVSASQTATFNGLSATLKLDNAAGFAGTLNNYGAGDVISLAALVATASSISGTTLAVTLSGGSTLNYALSGTYSNEHVAISTDGHTLTAYHEAIASTHTPEPIAFGNHHVGDIVSQALSLSNLATANGFSEALDASLLNATAGISASGSFTGLAAGATNSSGLSIGLNTSTSGAISGTAQINLASDGTGIDGYGQTSLGSQAVNVTGAVYAYAAPTLANDGTIALGNTHVGEAISGIAGITNGAAANGYSEALDALIYGASNGLSVSGSFTGLTAGGTDATSLMLSYLAGNSGAYSASALLALTSDGTNIDGLGLTSLGSLGLTITGAAYAYAVAQLANLTINLGVTHVGAADSMALDITNAALANAFSEALDAGWGSSSSGVLVSGSLMGLAAGSSDLASLLIGLATSSSGSFSGTALLNLLSDGTGIDGLGTTTLGGQTITVTGTVDNYAVAAFQDPGGPAETGTSTNETINLGSVIQGAGALTLSLGVLNGATGLSDLLQGTIATSGSTTGFINSGFGAFSGLGAGQGEHVQGITLTTTNAGVFTETIILSSAGTNASGYDGSLATETLTITGTVTQSGTTTYTLALGPNTITGAAGGNTFIAAAGSLNSRDNLTGGSGSNTLQLVGGGVFDVNSLQTFANIPIIDATEGQAAYKTLPATNEVVLLKDGETETVNVAAGTAAAGNTSAETIAIYAGTGTDTINLATGADSVFLGTGTDILTLGGIKNSITAGGGTATINATAAFASASIIGTTSGATTLNLTTAGTAILNAADTHLTVNLLAGSKLTLGAMGFITANGSAGTDTITAGAANDTLIGGTGDQLVGFASGNDTFYGASTALNGDKITNWTTGDIIDLTNMNSATLKALVYKAGASSGVLTVQDGTHTAAITFESKTLTSSNFTVIGSDGHGGTSIGF